MDVDNDDGSGYYFTHDNFLVYGTTGLKSNFGGHDNHHYGNIYCFTGLAVNDNTSHVNGHQDSFYQNTVILTGEEVGPVQCDPPGKTILFGNHYYTQSGKIHECNMTLEEWQSKDRKNDPNSTVEKWPTTTYIIQLARDKLGF